VSDERGTPVQAERVDPDLPNYFGPFDGHKTPYTYMLGKNSIYQSIYSIYTGGRLGCARGIPIYVYAWYKQYISNPNFIFLQVEWVDADLPNYFGTFDGHKTQSTGRGPLDSLTRGS